MLGFAPESGPTALTLFWHTITPSHSLPFRLHIQCHGSNDDENIDNPNSSPLRFHLSHYTCATVVWTAGFCHVWQIE